MNFDSVKRKIGDFLWNAFCDPDGVGVDFAAILDGAALAGVVLTEQEKEIVIRHMDDVDSWTYPAEFEAARDKIADATDQATGAQLYEWLAFVVGDDMAEAMIREWKGEE